MTAWIVFALFVAPALISLTFRLAAKQPHWRNAKHDATGQAPLPQQTPDAVVQVYAARTWGWRGGVGVHSWIATKRVGATHYTRYEVIGWQLRSGSVVVKGRVTKPDTQWFSNYPSLLADLRGPEADAVVDKIETAVAAYPYADEYEVWPGPNSNTFTAFVARRVPELRLDLPPTAIGKDYLADGALFGSAPSRTGYQLSLKGFGGVLLAAREGLEVNLLGLVVGVRAWPPAIKLPGLGTWPAASTRHGAAPSNRQLVDSSTS